MVVTRAVTTGMEVRIGGASVLHGLLGRATSNTVEARAHVERAVAQQSEQGKRHDEKGGAAELHRADKEKEKREREAAAEEIDVLGTGRDRKDMVRKWAQRLRGKPSLWNSVLVENGEAQPVLEGRIGGCRGEEVRQMVTKARYHIKATMEAVESRCRPECAETRCLCRLEGPQKLRGGYHKVRLR